ncbi:MAG: hypothetical protein JST80_08620 [Bdellovibrionales bacterium]|nr:hypothetical protein [Bdellovibrionales bacterium]
MKLNVFPTTTFVAQPEYFRQSYYDATNSGKHFEYSITSGDLSALKKLPDFLKANGSKVCVIIRPEWMAGFPDVVSQIKKMGVKLVGYATEPVPLDNGGVAHPDQMARLENLKRACGIPWDLVVFYDASSKKTVSKLGFENLKFHLLPMSFEMFKPAEQGEAKKEFDTVFIGRPTDHRERFLLPLKASRKVVHVAHGLYDEWARVLMIRAHSVINIHNLEYSNFEARVVQSLLCGMPTLSEPLSQDKLNQHELFHVFKTPEELFALVDDMKHKSIQRGDVQQHREVLKEFHINSLFKLIGDSL